MAIHSFPSYTQTTSPFAPEDLQSGLREEKIGVIGLGDAGLSLLVQFARIGHRVLGFDFDADTVLGLNASQSTSDLFSEDDLNELLKQKRIEATNSFERVAEVSVVIIAFADLEQALEAAKAIAPHLKKGTVVAHETQTHSGSPESGLKDALENGSGLSAGKDFFLAFSSVPKDTNKQALGFHIAPKLLSGTTPQCLELAADYYSRICDVIRQDDHS